MGAGGEGDDASRARAEQTFPPSVRVRRRSDYQLAQARGRRVQAPHFVFIVLPRDADQGPARLGITVTKKVGTAVARNRTKRVVRAVFRENRALFPLGADVIVIAKDGAPALGYGEVLAEVRTAAPQLAHAARSGLRPPRDDARRAAPRGKRTS